MSRNRKSKKGPRLQDVQELELSEKHIHLRLWLTIAFAVVGIALLVYAVRGFFSAQDGWQTIDVTTNGGANCASEYIFHYELGADSLPAAQEYRQIAKLYTTATETIYREFHISQGFEGVNNLYYLNRHPNETVEVSELLYDAFLQMKAHENRSVYLAPVYSLYRDLFFSADAEEAKAADPMTAPELTQFVRELSTFIQDPESVELELLGENRVCLHVSEAYQKYIEENGFDAYLDFFWMTNAFGVDYIAKTMADAGFTNGVITSYDGFTRNLDARGTDYQFSLYDRDGNTVYTAGALDYQGPMSFVFFKDYARSSLDALHAIALGDGVYRTAYLDPADGKNKTAVPQLLGYSREDGCAEVMLSLMPVYVADGLREESLSALSARGIETIYTGSGRCLLYSQTDAQFSGLYDRDGVRYVTKKQ